MPIGLNEGQFKGPVTGDYDAVNHVFTFGTWTFKESDEVIFDVLGEAGGEGTWDAHFLGAP